jgi:hypothetical protein
MIDRLPSLAPNAARTARTLARCHTRLALKKRHEPASPERVARRRARHYVIERSALLGFGVIYLSLLAFNVLQVLIR